MKKKSLILHLLFINMRMYVQFVHWTYFFVYLHIYCCQKTKILRTFISCFNCVIFFQTDHLKVDWMELCNNLEYRLCKKNSKLVFKCYFEKNIFYYIKGIKKQLKSTQQMDRSLLPQIVAGFTKKDDSPYQFGLQ